MGALQIAEPAFAFDLPVSMMTCPGYFMAHVAAALPNHLSMEVFGAGENCFMSSDTKIADGRIVLGNSPGIGIIVDEDVMKGCKMQGAISCHLSNPGRAKGAGLWGA